MTDMPHLFVLDHAVAEHAMAELRAHDTPPGRFAARARQLGLLVAAEATRSLATEPAEVRTPLETTEGRRLRSPAPVIVPILRAGLAMVEPVRTLVPEAVPEDVFVRTNLRATTETRSD